jgi:hypothetical protein
MVGFGGDVVANKKAKDKPDTSQLNDEVDQSQPDPLRVAFGAEALPVDIEYQATPGVPSRAAGVSLPTPWRIQLIGGYGEEGIIGLDIYGDTVLGRGPAAVKVHGVDLGPLGGEEACVSRRHAMLRPTSTRLYLIDLNSTNGTLHNSVPVGPGIARAVEDGDIILLGQLGLLVRVIARPAPRETTPPPGVHSRPSDTPESNERPALNRHTDD